MLYAGISKVRVGYGVLVCLILDNFLCQFFGNHPLNLVLVLPLDVDEAVVELSDDVGESVQFGFRFLSASTVGVGINL